MNVENTITMKAYNEYIIRTFISIIVVRYTHLTHVHRLLGIVD